MALTTLEPVAQLLSRVRAELGAAFDLSKPMRVSRAPGRLDVMGGMAAYTGSLVCEATLDCAAAVVLQSRADKQLQIFSFNLFDDHLPFTFNMSIDHLAQSGTEALRAGFAAPGMRWAAHLAGCLHMLHRAALVDLNHPSAVGLNLAVLSTVPSDAGVGSSAAIEVATMLNLVDHFSLGDKLDRVKIAAMCQAVENQVVGSTGGILEQFGSCCGEDGALLPILCQPLEIQPIIPLPTGVGLVGIDSRVKQNIGDGRYAQIRCAAFMGHTIIVNKMREMGHAAGRALLSDPMRGYLANLDPEDYKRLFRPYVPQSIVGEKFLADFGPTIDTTTTIDRKTVYPVLGATDHHVLEAQRVRRFADLISAAHRAPPRSREQGALLDKAGHLMYASHLSYSNDAGLGADECDLLVKLVRDREREGLYGARITDRGSGGTVAVLCDLGDRADAAIARIMAEYEKQTGRQPEAFLASSPGAWQSGTATV